MRLLAARLTQRHLQIAFATGLVPEGAPEFGLDGDGVDGGTPAVAEVVAGVYCGEVSVDWEEWKENCVGVGRTWWIEFLLSIIRLFVIDR